MADNSELETTLGSAIPDLYKRTEDLLSAIEQVSAIIEKHQAMIDALSKVTAAHNRAINSLIPLKDRLN
jgi:prefoldin subunit 5